MCPVLTSKTYQFRAASAIGLGALLLSGCAVFEGDRRPFFDHAHYAPVGGHAEDIFVTPVGHVDRTIPNRLGRLDVAPANYSFETDKAARTRAKLTLPPQPQTPAPPKAGPQTGLEPNATPAQPLASQGDAQSASQGRSSRQRSPARPVSPGVEIAPPSSPQTQSQTQVLPPAHVQPQASSAASPLSGASAVPPIADPVVGVVPTPGPPAVKSSITTIVPAAPPKP